MVEAFLEPISPLQLPGDGLDIVKEFAQAGQPVSIGPMAMTAGTAPGTLAGTLAQENAEILAGIVITQLLAPGTPITYGGIPHIMDPRTGICSFGSPEQGLMAVAMIQIARSYGFPAYINVGLTDAKLPDAQAGMEKAATLLLGVLAGADTFGHCGICGTDHAGSLLWLAFDDELMSYVKRIARGFAVDAEHLATDVIHSVGPAGNFLAEEHTVRHFREELWLPNAVWTRQPYDLWQSRRRNLLRRPPARAREQHPGTSPASASGRGPVPRDRPNCRRGKARAWLRSFSGSATNFRGGPTRLCHAERSEASGPRRERASALGRGPDPSRSLRMTERAHGLTRLTCTGFERTPRGHLQPVRVGGNLDGEVAARLEGHYEQ